MRRLWEGERGLLKYGTYHSTIQKLLSFLDVLKTNIPKSKPYLRDFSIALNKLDTSDVHHDPIYIF